MLAAAFPTLRAISSCLAALLGAAGSARGEGIGPAPPTDQKTVRLPVYVVEASSPPVVLKLSFRHHMMWAGIKTLTFTAVPASWARAGIKIGDQIVAIDGHPLAGMALTGQFASLLKAKFPPLDGQAAPRGAVPLRD